MVPDFQRSCRTSYNCGVTNETKELYEDYKMPFKNDPFNSETTKTGNRILDEIAESREIKRKSLTSAVTFTTDQVTKGISSCSNTRALEPDKLSVFHLKHLGSRGIEYLTAIFNDTVTSCRIPSIWKSSIVIPIPKTRQGLLSQNFLSLRQRK